MIDYNNPRGPKDIRGFIYSWEAVSHGRAVSQPPTTRLTVSFDLIFQSPVFFLHLIVYRYEVDRSLIKRVSFHFKKAHTRPGALR